MYWKFRLFKPSPIFCQNFGIVFSMSTSVQVLENCGQQYMYMIPIYFCKYILQLTLILQFPIMDLAKVKNEDKLDLCRKYYIGMWSLPGLCSIYVMYCGNSGKVDQGYQPGYSSVVEQHLICDARVPGSFPIPPICMYFHLCFFLSLMCVSLYMIISPISSTICLLSSNPIASPTAQ